MSREPTGRVQSTPTGADLIVTRSFRADIEDVWSSVTEPDSTARWFGRWEGESGAGNVVRVQMGFEEGTPWCDVAIVECEPPRHLSLQMKDVHGIWLIELTLQQQEDTTCLTLVHHLTNPSLASDAGPGWEYYLDMLVAARAGQALPSFSDYYPAQKAYYLEASAAVPQQPA